MIDRDFTTRHLIVSTGLVVKQIKLYTDHDSHVQLKSVTPTISLKMYLLFAAKLS